MAGENVVGSVSAILEADELEPEPQLEVERTMDGHSGADDMRLLHEEEGIVLFSLVRMKFGGSSACVGITGGCN